MSRRDGMEGRTRRERERAANADARHCAPYISDCRKVQYYKSAKRSRHIIDRSAERGCVNPAVARKFAKKVTGKPNFCSCPFMLMHFSVTLLDKSSIFIFNVLHLEGVQKCLIFSNHRSRKFNYQKNLYLECSRIIITI